MDVDEAMLLAEAERALVPPDDPEERDRMAAELVRLIEEDQAARRRQMRKLRDQARQVYAAAEGWAGVTSLADWTRTWKKARKQYEAGRFLMERLGADRLLDPTLLATLWYLRQQLLEDLGAATPAETMLVDMAVLNYATALRVNGWIGNTAMTLEAQLFGEDPPMVRFREKWGRQVAAELSVEAVVDRIRLQLLPLFDRANRGMIRNLQALKAMREPPAAAQMSIARADQVNVAHQQIVGTETGGTQRTGSLSGAAHQSGTFSARGGAGASAT